MEDSLISNVSDTALWVAYYRAEESDRPDALFKDSFAAELASERGKEIARRMKGSRYTGWSLVIRTCIIDDYVRKLVRDDGVDTIINLGAGLDTRPYRLELSEELRWVEVDFPGIINLKNAKLKNQKPHCRLERLALDLSDRDAMRQLLTNIGTTANKALVITEGVIPYLTEAEVASLAASLKGSPYIKYWIVDYFATFMYRYLQTRQRRKQMRHAPFKFFPKDWFGFFTAQGWTRHEIRYLSEESIKLGRAVPMPVWSKILRSLFPLKVPERYNQFSGYAILVPD